MTAFSKLAIAIEKNKTNVEKVRQDVEGSWSSTGVISALLLTMNKIHEKAEQDHHDAWLDCDTFPCNEVHVVLASIAYVACAAALILSANNYTWCCLTPEAETVNFMRAYPGAVAWPINFMFLGVIAWGLDTLLMSTLLH